MFEQLNNRLTVQMERVGLKKERGREKWLVKRAEKLRQR